METQIVMRPKVMRLIERFKYAKGAQDVPQMMSIVKRLGYKEDCSAETIQKMREEIDATTSKVSNSTG